MNKILKYFLILLFVSSNTYLIFSCVVENSDTFKKTYCGTVEYREAIPKEKSETSYYIGFLIKDSTQIYNLKVELDTYLNKSVNSRICFDFNKRDIREYTKEKNPLDWYDVLLFISVFLILPQFFLIINILGKYTNNF